MRLSNIVIVGLLAVTLIAAYWLQHHSSLTALPQSNASAVVCTNPPGCTEHAKLRVNFSVFPVQTEEEINAELTFQNGWELKSAWLEGVNMYMGKTTAIIEKKQVEKGRANVVFFLGSCGEPTMHWQLKTEWINSGNNANLPNSVFAYFDFFTQQN